MEETVLRAGEGAATGQEEGNSSTRLNASKPLHRFIKGEGQSLGIVVLIFGCAELLNGFELAKGQLENSTRIYIPFWQGALFVISGNLSIYTVVHPSKKMVTVCLAMYIVTLLGVIVSAGYRIQCVAHLSHGIIFTGPYMDGNWSHNRIGLVLSVEAILLGSSLCVSALLIFLSIMARLALKSAKTQMVLQRVLPAASDTTST